MYLSASLIIYRCDLRTYPRRDLNKRWTTSCWAILCMLIVRCRGTLCMYCHHLYDDTVCRYVKLEPATGHATTPLENLLELDLYLLLLNIDILKLHHHPLVIPCILHVHTIPSVYRKSQGFERNPSHIRNHGQHGTSRPRCRHDPSDRFRSMNIQTTWAYYVI